MRHWFIDKEPNGMASWQEAFPDSLVFGRDHLSRIGTGDEPGVLWFRIRAGEVLTAVFHGVALPPRILFVVLADEPSDSLIEEALASGASGCCNTYAAPDVLRQVALVVENGGLWIGRSLLSSLVGSTSRLLAKNGEKARVDNWCERLSERETQVARLVANGASNREIAEQLFITERTVKAHLSAVFEKLAIRDRLQLSLRINGVSI
ncbi:MAG: DNA-binding response regulator [Proteobacteria bacterium]|nr:DNA-binding response regulator [Pseudomonadota bacterium]